MPLDPSIANPTPIQIQDPLEQYGNYLRSSYLQSEIGKAKMAAKQNALVNNAFLTTPKNSDGTTDINGVAQTLAASGGGIGVAPLLMDYAKSQSDRAMATKNLADASSANATALKTTMDQYQNKWSTVDTKNPQAGLAQALTLINDTHNNGLVAKFHQSDNDPNQSFKNDVMQANAASEATISGKDPDAWGKYALTETAGSAAMAAHTTTPSSNGAQQWLTSVPNLSVGTPSASIVPGSLSNMQLTPAQAAALDPSTQTNLVAAKTIPSLAFDDYKTQHEAVNKIPESIVHIDGALGLLKSAITGVGQTQQLDVARALKFFGVDATGKKIEDTQELNKRLNGFVLDQLRGSGTGRTTNMLMQLTKDSNATGTMEPGATRKVLLSARADLLNQVQKHNDLANRLLATPGVGDQMRRFSMGPVPMLSDYGIDPKDIAKLKANPTPGSQANFDAQYDQPGAASRILGGSQPGATPLAPGAL